MTMKTTGITLLVAAAISFAIVSYWRKSNDDQSPAVDALSRTEAAPAAFEGENSRNGVVWTNAPANGQSATTNGKSPPTDDDVLGSMDPLARNYDPIIAATTAGMTPRELADREPRDPAFASPREATLHALINEQWSKALSEDVAITDVRCATSSCIVEGDFPGASLEQANDAMGLMQLRPLAEMSQPELSFNDDVAHIVMTLLFRREHRDEQKYRVFLEQMWHEMGRNE